MIIDKNISENEIRVLRELDHKVFVTALFGLSDVASIVDLEDVSPKNIQNWAVRSFLKVTKSGRYRPTVFSGENVVQASVIAHLHKETPLALASSIGLTVAERASKLVSEGYDFWGKLESNNLGSYYYSADGDKEHGIFLYKEDLAKIIIGDKIEPELSGVEQRILAAEKLILAVLIRIAKLRISINKRRQ